MNAIQEIRQKQELAVLASKATGAPVSPEQLTRSALRSDTAMISGQSYLNISFTYSKPSPNGSEILLQINDMFIATCIRLSAKKLTATPTDALHAAAQEFTYPNTFVFDGTTEVTAIFALWNAVLSFRQNQDIAFPTLWTGDMKFSPDQQYGSPTGINATPTTVRELTDSKNSPNYGYLPIQPLVLKGSDQLYASLQLAGSVNLTETNEFNFFTIQFGGYKIAGINRVG